MTGVRMKSILAIVASGTATKTWYQIQAGSNHRVHIRELAITYAGATSTAVPHNWKILVQTTSGTATTNNPAKANSSDDETIEATGASNHTVEPTDSTILYDFIVPVYQGGLWVPFDYGDLVVPGGTRLGFKVFSPAASISFAMTIVAEE